MSDSIWVVEPGDWPPASKSTLTAEQVHRTLNDAFDRYYDAAVCSLAQVEIPSPEVVDR